MVCGIFIQINVCFVVLTLVEVKLYLVQVLTVDVLRTALVRSLVKNKPLAAQQVRHVVFPISPTEIEDLGS